MKRLEAGLSLRNYRLQRRLGAGGGGEVWLATDGRGRTVALKARARQGATEDRRLRREFERLRTLRLPGVVRVLDVGADQGFIFYTMAAIDGVPFDRYVAAARDPAGRVARAAEAGAQVACALAGIHRLGLAHRDLKPQNVLVDGEGRVTLVDFGTVRAACTDGTSEVRGTVAYMAPEQRIDLPHDHRVDAYALGVMLHEALSGEPAGRWPPGRPRPTLLRDGPHVPPALGWLVDRLLSLDPAERPSAEEAQAVLEAVASGPEALREIGPVPWPSPAAYEGDASPLLEGSAVVVGRPGTGRRRMVEEARWLWYRKGYRSLAGNCTPDRAFGALDAVLAELFAGESPAARRELAGDEAPLLRTVWPELPVPGHAAAGMVWPPDPIAVGRALGQVLARRAPIAVVLWNLDEADPGTAAAVAALVRELPEGVRVWATARRAGSGLSTRTPPSWRPGAEARVLETLLPEGERPLGPPGRTPLESCARAWRVLARQRGLPEPASSVPPGAEPLALLDEPFPMEVARALTPLVDLLVEQGHLDICTDAPGPSSGASFSDRDDEFDWSDQTEPTEPAITERLAFADPGTRLLALAALETAGLDRQRIHHQAALAWRRAGSDPRCAEQCARHAVRSGRPADADLLAAVRAAIDRSDPTGAERWLRVRDLYLSAKNREQVSADADFLTAFARMYVDLELRPRLALRGGLRQLARRARTIEQQARVAWLLLIREARHGDRVRAIERGRRNAEAIADRLPAIAAMMFREVALALLAAGELAAAVRAGRRALELAREAGQREAGPGATPVLVQAEVDAATTLSAVLIYSNRLSEAAELCRTTGDRCRAAGLARGEGAMAANLAVSFLHLGLRDEAAEAAARCRAVQPRHRDPVVLANCALIQARLAIERGEIAAGRLHLDEAITVGQALDARRLLAECWALVLELAVHTADPVEANRAIAVYGRTPTSPRSDLDNWPAVLGRWRWLCGDLESALAITRQPRRGHGGLCVKAEHARLLLVAGRYEEAYRCARATIDRAESAHMAELMLFASLVAGAAVGVPDAEYLPLLANTRESRWVHLYLGALHLDAIRRQLRGENVSVLLRQLRALSFDLGHRLYGALAREQAW